MLDRHSYRNITINKTFCHHVKYEDSAKADCINQPHIMSTFYSTKCALVPYFTVLYCTQGAAKRQSRSPA